MATAREWRNRLYRLHVRGFVVALMVLAMVWWAITKDRPMWLIPAMVLAAMAAASPWWLRYQRKAESSVHILRALAIELDRARRYEHPMALVRVGSWVTAAEDRFGYKTLLQMVRANDASLYVDDDLYVVLPETGRDGALALIARLEAHVGPRADAHSGLAVFPGDGVTAGALLDRCAAPYDASADEDVIILDSNAPAVDIAVVESDPRLGRTTSHG